MKRGGLFIVRLRTLQCVKWNPTNSVQGHSQGHSRRAKIFVCQQLDFAVLNSYSKSRLDFSV